MYIAFAESLNSVPKNNYIINVVQRSDIIGIGMQADDESAFWA